MTDIINLNLIYILLEGTITLLIIFSLTLFFSLPLGLTIAFLSISKNKIISKITNIYILVMRGTPLLLQIICVYFLPYYLFNISYNRFLALIIALIVNYAAYFGEIYRGGIQSIPKGQYEAAFSLGFNKRQIVTYILLPQIIKRILPALSNEVISLIKDTSLSQVIGISELFALAQKQSNYNFSIMPLILAGIIYLLLTHIITCIFKFIEKKMSYYKE